MIEVSEPDDCDRLIAMLKKAGIKYELSDAGFGGIMVTINGNIKAEFDFNGDLQSFTIKNKTTA
jgi:hypothetical protein